MKMIIKANASFGAGRSLAFKSHQLVSNHSFGGSMSGKRQTISYFGPIWWSFCWSGTVVWGVWSRK